MRNNYLKKINIRSYAGYQKQEINLDPDINLFIGKNGAGKTFFLNRILYPLLSFNFSNLELVEGIDVSYTIHSQCETVNYEINYTIFSEPISSRNSDGIVCFKISAILRDVVNKKNIFIYERSHSGQDLKILVPCQMNFHVQDHNSDLFQVSNLLPQHQIKSNELVNSFLEDERIKKIIENSQDYNFLKSYVQNVICDHIFSSSALLTISSFMISGDGSTSSLHPFPGNFEFSESFLKSFFQISFEIEQKGGYQCKTKIDRTLMGAFFQAYFYESTIPLFVEAGGIKKEDIKIKEIVEKINTSLCNTEHVDFFLKTSRFQRIWFQAISENIQSSVKNEKIIIKLGIQVLIEDQSYEVKPLNEALTEGEKRFLCYCLMINLVKDNYFLIDEIENGLHPEWLSYIMNDDLRQLFISSHNPFVVNNLLNIVDCDNFIESNFLHICKMKDEASKSYSVEDMKPGLKGHINSALKQGSDLSKLLTKYL